MASRGNASLGEVRERIKIRGILRVSLQRAPKFVRIMSTAGLKLPVRNIHARALSGPTDAHA